jgi:hypothetical protein
VARIRLMLRCLLVVTVALGLASAPLYAAAQAERAPSVTKHQHEHLTKVGQRSPDHDHASPAKPHAMDQSCCHPGCIMAVVPGFSSLTIALLPWVTVPIPRDRGVVPVASSGPERPPKRA